MAFQKQLHDILPLLDDPLALIESAKAGCLPPVLHIVNISLLMRPDSEKLQNVFRIMLKTAIRNKDLPVVSVKEYSDLTMEYEQSRNPEKYREPRPPGCIPSPTINAVAYQDSDLLPDSKDTEPNERKMYVVHRDNMKEWLQKENEWPLDKENLLFRWWPQVESESITERSSSSQEVTLNMANNIFRREGQMWTLCYNGETKHFKHSKGLCYISYLLGSPHREYHVAELVKAAETPEKEILSFSSGEISTIQTIENYRRQLAEIRIDLAEVEKTKNQLEIKELLFEKEALEEQIKQAVGLGGKLKKFSGENKKQAKAVSEAITRCMKVIKKNHPSLWQHLLNAISRGEFLSYNPETDISWIISQ